MVTPRPEDADREDVDPASALGAAELPLPEGQPRGFVPEEAEDGFHEPGDEAPSGAPEPDEPA